jgi:putative holliday junction resolvase
VNSGEFCLRVLALDIGDKRIGVAVSDPLGMLARPLLVLENEGDEAAVQGILKLVEENQAERIIVGLPLAPDGGLGLQAEKIKSLAEKLREGTKVPLEYRDERGSTAEAKNILGMQGKLKKGSFEKKGAYDAISAAVILQGYLNEKQPLVYPEE